MSFPYNPPGHIPGFHQPGTLNQMYGPAVLAAQAEASRRAAAEAAIAARLQRMTGRWFAPEHTWVAVDGERATVGITDYATWMLMDILYVSLPEAGTIVTAGEVCGQVEAVQAVSGIYAPVDGTVTEINGRLDAEPDLVNDEPYGAGWMFRLAVGPYAEASLRPGLLSPGEYEEFTRKTV